MGFKETRLECYLTNIDKNFDILYNIDSSPTTTYIVRVPGHDNDIKFTVPWNMRRTSDVRIFGNPAKVTLNSKCVLVTRYNDPVGCTSVNLEIHPNEDMDSIIEIISNNIDTNNTYKHELILHIQRLVDHLKNKYMGIPFF